MNELDINQERIELGKRLQELREHNQVSKYAITQKTGLRLEIINSIESGNKAYTVDSLIKYTTACEIQLFFN